MYLGLEVEKKMTLFCIISILVLLTHMMSAKNGGVQTLPIPLVSQSQKLAYPPSPLVRKNQKPAHKSDFDVLILF